MIDPLPWKNDDYVNFKTLVNPTNAANVIDAQNPPRVTLATLLSRAPEQESLRTLIGDPAKLGETKEERYRHYMGHIERNAYCRWLKRDPSFRKAYDFFKRQQHKKRASNPYQVDWAELRFLDIAAAIGVFALAQMRKIRPPVPSSRERDQALARAKSLKESFARGIELKSYIDSEHLSQLLNVLITELSDKSYKRPRADPNLLGRQYVALLTQQLLSTFGEASPSIVNNFAAVIGYSADASAIDRHRKRATSEWQNERRKLLAAGLRQT